MKWFRSLKPHQQGVLALIIANIIWGAASPIFKLSLQNIPPFTLAFVRFYGAALLVFPFVATNPWVNRKDWGSLILLSILGITVNISAFFLGLKYAPSINAPIIGSAGPVFLCLFSILFLREKLHPKVLAGMMVSLIGVLVIVGQPLLSGERDGAITGNLLFVLATLGAVGNVLLCKKILERYSAMIITFWSFLIGSITFFPLFLFEMITLSPFETLDYRGWTGIFFGIFLSSALAYYLFHWGIDKMEAQEIGVFTYIDPLVAAIFAIWLLGETITPVFLLGSLLVFSGIYVSEGRFHYHPFHKLRH